MESYPHLKKAIEFEDNYVEILWEEKDVLEGLSESKDTQFIKYQNVYYEIFIAYQD